MTLKLCQIIGARPQFIKYFPVSEAIRRINEELPGSIRDVLIHTGQHYDYQMSKIFFDELGIRKPDYHLEAGSGTHSRQTADILMKAEPVLMREKPDITVVYGDTNSTLAGALAAAKLNIPVAHIEAGLRSFNRSMPEEINRILTDRISQLLFCPSETAVAHLRDEGFRSVRSGDRSFNPSVPAVYFSGDVMADVFLLASEMARSRPSILKPMEVEPGQYALLTLHRAENTDDPNQFRKIRDFINRFAEDVPVIFPVHPRIIDRLSEELDAFHPNVRRIDPAGYFHLLQLLSDCRFVLTDSGGLQKEAFWAQKPCITLRQETEWVETVYAGWNVLWQNFKGFDNFHKKDTQPYGDGKAAEKIVNILLNREGK